MKHQIFSKNQLDDKILAKFPKNEDSGETEYVFCFGGDGTFLKAHRMVKSQSNNTKYVLFNEGHIGFYTEFLIDDLSDVLDMISKDSYFVKEYGTLDVNVLDEKGYNKTIAINEIVISNPIRTAIIDVYIDDELFEHFRGSGLIISTPSGSSAYNKSVGGSVIDEEIDAIELTELAPINNRIYKSLNSSLVLSSKRRLKLVIHNDEATFVCVDGRNFKSGDIKEIEINYSLDKVKIISRSTKDHFSKIKNTFLK